MKIRFYHYPKCSTSNAGLTFLRSKHIEPEIVLYCDDGIKKTELKELMNLLQISKPLGIIKRNGLTYRHLGLAHKEPSDDEMLDVIVQNPKLLQRPILVCGNMAVVGKNEEVIQSFLTLCQQS
jgi:arsenate reductase (glutaredoxin)